MTPRHKTADPRRKKSRLQPAPDGHKPYVSSRKDIAQALSRLMRREHLPPSFILFASALKHSPLRSPSCQRENGVGRCDHRLSLSGHHSASPGEKRCQ